MSYKIAQIEVTQPLPHLTLSDGDTGLALVLRRKERPIGFLMQILPKSEITAEELAQWIAKEIGSKLLQETIKEELISPANREQFPTLTVAICTKDRPENLARCLDSLLKLRSAKADATRSLNSYFEVLIVDNAPSSDRTKELVATLPNVNYVREPKAGFDFARNRAIQEATGEILAYLDDDVTVDRQWLNGLVEAWTENPDVGAFTGLILPYELETEAQILFEQRRGFRRGFAKIRYGQVLSGNPLYPCGSGIFGAGCNMAFKREVLLELGGFDEALDTGAPLPGGGDLDIFYRIIRGGYPLIYEPQYLIYYQHRREMEKLRRQYWTWGLGLMAFVVKSYQHDPSQRSKLIGLVGWWFKDQVRQLKESFLGLHPLPPRMILSETWGSIVGLLGEYPRSQKRIDQIKRQFPDSEVSFSLKSQSLRSN